MKRRNLIVMLGGTAAAWCVTASAQQRPALGMIGFLSTRSPRESAKVLEAFRHGLAETGYAEGRNISIEYRWAEGKYDQIPALASDLVHRQVAVIVAAGGVESGLAAKAATSTIPIVFIAGGDPVEYGLVPSLNHPGGNVTGVSMMANALAAKRLELLFELVPQAQEIAMLANPASIYTEHETKEVLEAGHTLGRQMEMVKATTEAELDAAFANMAQQKVDALIVAADPFFNSRRSQLVALAARYAIPAIYVWREFALAGGLISYGTSITGGYHLGGVYTGQILKGAKPANMPVQQPTKFELVINLKTAKALGLAVPPSLLASADEAIE